ncbi:MAG: hypothetical protein RL087_1814, partial [Pseudomonadota bacterium]
SNPLVGSITALALIMLVWPLVSRAMQSLLQRKQGQAHGQVDPV